MSVFPGPVQVAALLEEAASLARLLAGEKPVEVRVEAARDLVVETDHHKLRQSS